MRKHFSSFRNRTLNQEETKNYTIICHWFMSEKKNACWLLESFSITNTGWKQRRIKGNYTSGRNTSPSHYSALLSRFAITSVTQLLASYPARITQRQAAATHFDRPFMRGRRFFVEGTAQLKMKILLYNFTVEYKRWTLKECHCLVIKWIRTGAVKPKNTVMVL